MSKCVADPQLRGRVMRIVEDFQEQGNPLVFDAIYQALITQHREYSRKPFVVMRRLVTSVIDKFLADNPPPEPTEEEKEAAAHAQKEMRERAEKEKEMERASSLNATLYKKPDSSESADKVDKEAGSTELSEASARLGKLGKRRRETSSKEEGVPSVSKKPASSQQSLDLESPTGQWALPPYIRPAARYSDVGGVGPLMKTLREVVDYPLMHPEVYQHLGVEPPRGVLLYGPPGVGKTLLANALAGELGVYFRPITGPELVGGLSGESEGRLRALFDDVATNAPAILFIDEIDAIAPKRDSSQRGMEKRMVAQLLSCIDGLSSSRTNNGAPVIVIAATNRPDSLDPGLRRTGRFDREISVPIPDEPARVEILKVLTRNMRLDRSSDSSKQFDFTNIARSTPGYVGADLAALAKEAANCAIERALGGADAMLRRREEHKITIEDALEDPNLITEGESQTMAIDSPSDECSTTGSDSQCPTTADNTNNILATHEPEAANLQIKPYSAEELSNVYITEEDFMAASKKVQPSALREGFATVPNISWDDVGALSEVRSELEMAIVAPLRRPEVFSALGLKVPAGVLMFGPPGCGKTLLARAIASESAANFISVKGPELLDKYVGESERAVRALFTRARASAPCIVFFDELDSLAPRRGSGGDGASGGSVTERVVNQLLTEMDGLESRRDVFVIAATNRPDIIDPAMLRPGRLDKLLYVPLPSPSERESILRTLTRNIPMHEDVNLKVIAESQRCNRFSGADLASIVRESAVIALKEYFANERKASGTEGKLDNGLLVCPTAPTSTTELPQPKLMHNHFLGALDRVMPSVSVQDEKLYEALRANFRRITISSSDSAKI